jgi:hypothetical protein
MRCGARLDALRLAGDRYALPLGLLALFIVLSLGLYLLVWAARCYRFANAAWAAQGSARRRSPWGRSLLLLVPVYSYWVYYRLVADVRKAGRITRGPGPGLLLLAFLAAPALLIAEWTVLRPSGLAVVGGDVLLFTPFVLATLPLQGQINRECEAATPGAAARYRLDWRGGAGILVGVVVWIILLARVVISTRESTGVATIQFGHGYNAAQGALLAPSTTGCASHLCS